MTLQARTALKGIYRAPRDTHSSVALGWFAFVKNYKGHTANMAFCPEPKRIAQILSIRLFPYGMFYRYAELLLRRSLCLEDFIAQQCIQFVRQRLYVRLSFPRIREVRFS